MRFLFDVNVLIAIIDEGHEHHWKAHDGGAANISAGWAAASRPTCMSARATASEILAA